MCATCSNTWQRLQEEASKHHFCPVLAKGTYFQPNYTGALSNGLGNVNEVVMQFISNNIIIILFFFIWPRVLLSYFKGLLDGPNYGHVSELIVAAIWPVLLPQCFPHLKMLKLRLWAKSE